MNFARASAAVWLAAAFVWLAPGGMQPLAAQDEKEEKPANDKKDEKQIVTQIYQRTKTAKSAAEFGDIIDRIQAAQKGELSKPNADYLKSLLGWAYNRRGEVLVEDAAKAADEKAAKKLAAQALADFDESIKHDAKRWKAFLNRGVSRAQAGKLKEAEADMSTAVRLNPNYANAWFNRGEIYYALGQYDKAIADYRRVLQLSPNDFGAFTSLGHAYFVQKDYNQAIAYYDRAVQLQPQSAEALANRGDAYQRNGQWDRAGADYLAAAELDENLGRVYQSGAWLLATCPIAEFRDPERAVAYAERAVKLDGDSNYQYLDTLAAAYARASDFEKAKSTITRAIEKAPEADKEVLRKRQALYTAGKAYEQFMFK